MIGFCAAMILTFAAPNNCAVDVTVGPGDTLTAIAETHDTTWRRLWDHNDHLKHPDVLQVGEMVAVPRADVDVEPRPLPQPRVVARAARSRPEGDSAPPAASTAPTGTWDLLAACESGGNWHINTGNGYSGGLQWHPDTWQRAGGTNYAPSAWQATREQEIAVAEAWLARTSWSQWPACARKLGLR